MNKLQHLKPFKLGTMCQGKKIIDAMQVYFRRSLIALGSFLYT